MKQSRFTEDGMDASQVLLDMMEVHSTEGDCHASCDRAGHCEADFPTAHR